MGSFDDSWPVRTNTVSVFDMSVRSSREPTDLFRRLTSSLHTQSSAEENQDSGVHERQRSDVEPDVTPMTPAEDTSQREYRDTQVTSEIDNIKEERGRLEEDVRQKSDDSTEFRAQIENQAIAADDYKANSETLKPKGDDPRDENKGMKPSFEEVTDERKTLQRGISELSGKLDSEKHKQHTLNRDLRDLEERNQQLAAERNHLQKRIRKISDQLDSEKHDHEDLKKDFINLEDKNKQVTSERDSFKDANKSLKTERDSFKEANNSLKTERDSFKEANYSLKTERDCLKEDVREMSDKIQDLRAQRGDLRDELEYLDKKNQRLQKDLDWWSKIECTLVVPSQCHSNGMAVTLIEQVLSELRGDNANVQLEVKESTAISKQDGVVILPCISGSWVESDMDATISSVQLSPYLRIVLIVFHHVPFDKGRPFASPTCQRVANQYPQCDVIYHAFFWQGKFYGCKNNDLFLENFKRYLSR